MLCSASSFYEQVIVLKSHWPLIWGQESKKYWVCEECRSGLIRGNLEIKWDWINIEKLRYENEKKKEKGMLHILILGWKQVQHLATVQQV